MYVINTCSLECASKYTISIYTPHIYIQLKQHILDDCIQLFNWFDSSLNQDMLMAINSKNGFKLCFWLLRKVDSFARIVHVWIPISAGYSKFQVEPQL
jgi:hypothetical protein